MEFCGFLCECYNVTPSKIKKNVTVALSTIPYIIYLAADTEGLSTNVILRCVMIYSTSYDEHYTFTVYANKP